MKIFNLVLIILLFTHTAISQTIAEESIDEFTGSSIKRSSWETFNQSMKFIGHFRISKIDSIFYFDLKMMRGDKVFSISEGSDLMFKLDNNEIVTVKALTTEITCTGCGAIGFNGSTGQGIQISYLLSSDQLKLLKEHKVVKVRVYTTDGYLEDEIKEKFIDRISKACALFFF